jgi:hypothetical protein
MAVHIHNKMPMGLRHDEVVTATNVVLGASCPYFNLMACKNESLCISLKLLTNPLRNKNGQPKFTFLQQFLRRLQ